jgi:hypothetical protein
MRTRHAITSGLLGLAMIAAAAAPASAQGTGSKLPVTFDVVGGINIATLSFPVLPPEFEELGFEFSLGNRIGLVAGALVGVPVRDGITFETGGLLSYKGASVDLTIPDLGLPPEFPEIGPVTGQISIVYLDVPVIGRFRVVRSSRTTVSALGGVTLGFKLDAEETVTAFGMTQTIPIDEGLSGFDFGLTFGGRLEFGRVLADIRYTLGMLHLAEEEGPNGETLKNRVLSLMAGWRF